MWISSLKILIIFIIFISFTLGLLVGHYDIPRASYKKLVKVISSGQAKYSSEHFDEMLSCLRAPNVNIDTNNFKENTFQYSFFAAGHTYGKPGVHSVGLYPKFYRDILGRSNKKKIDFGFLTGDVVKDASLKSWEAVKSQLNKLSFDTYIAPGNHDVGDGPNNAKRDIYKYLYGETFYTFYKYNDLFIVLDPNINGWDIKKDQLSFLKSALRNNHGRNNNIFILMHQVIWSSRDRDKSFEKIIYNSSAGKGNGITNYWSEVAPLLEEQDSDIYVISGDVGAFDNGSELFCHNVKNVKYLASGMGGGARDNYLIFTVTGGEVSTKVIVLN